ncbi:MAG: hypothetical protein Q9201_004319 [Fulgogasparrea decipioides]
MNASTFPDWKRIGRRIGKKLRDVLDPRPGVPGPSAEEREAQRIRDGFKGFVYFDSFDEVEAWKPTDVDPIQQANCPLLSRAAGEVHDCVGPKTKLLLCHDYGGGYHDYEGLRPAPLDGELYNCKYLQFVDTFIYFSHKLICVPSPSWINVLHRNGVKVLGTCLIEPQTPNMERLLVKESGRFTIANTLAEIANAYDFDGWLLNIEQDTPNTHQDWTHQLIDFLRELREQMGEYKEVLWYDALTTDGDVYYQNGLTESNLPFAEVANGLFTNYKWTERSLAKSSFLATRTGMPTSDVFFGIDLWAQNTNMPGPPRVTYPPKGGGGTNTGLEPHRGQLRSTLSSQDPLPNLWPLSAKEWEEIDEGPITRVLFGELNPGPSPSLKIWTKLAGCYEAEEKSPDHSVSPTAQAPFTARLRLYKLKMPADGSLEAAIDVEIKRDSDDIICGISLTYLDITSQQTVEVRHTLSRHRQFAKAVTRIPVQNSYGLLVELGIFMTGDVKMSTSLLLMEIARIVIKPKLPLTTAYQIQDIHTMERSRHSETQKRIVWSWVGDAQQDGEIWPEGMPWSRTTGPFSSFTIYLAGKAIGQAHCLEFLMKDKDVETLGDKITVEVVGNLFGGGHVNSPSITALRKDLILI